MDFLSRRRHSSPLGFASALFGLTLITQLFHAFNLAYYTESGMVDLFWASICKIVFVIVDWLNDLIFGALSERTKSKWGKRIPWLVGGMIWIPVFVIMTYAINAQSGLSPAGFVIYYLFVSVSLENASTVMYTNYNAMFPTLFTTTHQRSKTASYKHVLEIIAMLVCYIMTPIFVDEMGFSYFQVGFLYGGVYIICIFIALFTMNIEDDVRAENEDRSHYSFGNALRDSLTDKSFVIYNVAQSFFAAILSIVVSLYPMYCHYVLNIAGFQQAVVFACFFGSLLISVPGWYIMIRKIGFVKVWIIDYMLLPLALSALFIPNDFVQGALVCALIGPLFGGLMITPDMLFAEIIDIDRVKHHISREAALGSIGNLVSRVSVIVAAIATAILANIMGYRSGSDPGPNPTLAFKSAFGLMLPVIALLGVISAWGYIRFSKEDRRVLHELKRMSLDQTTEVSISEVINGQ